MNVGERLKEARAEAGLSGRKAADGIKSLDKYLLSKIENGVCMPVKDHINALCTVYDICPEEVIELVAQEYGLKKSRKPVRREDASDVYKFATPMPRDVATAFLNIVREWGYHNIQSWFLAVAYRAVEHKKAARRAGTREGGKRK